MKKSGRFVKKTIYNIYKYKSKNLAKNPSKARLLKAALNLTNLVFTAVRV